MRSKRAITGMLLVIPGGDGSPFILGFEDKVADFANGTPAAFLRGNKVGKWFNVFYGIGNAHGKARPF